MSHVPVPYRDYLKHKIRVDMLREISLKSNVQLGVTEEGELFLSSFFYELDEDGNKHLVTDKCIHTKLDPSLYQHLVTDEEVEKKLMKVNPVTYLEGKEGVKVEFVGDANNGIPLQLKLITEHGEFMVCPLPGGPFNTYLRVSV